MKKYVYFAVLAAFVPLTVHLLRETRRLRDQVQNVEEERRRTAVAAIAAGWVGISEDEQEKMIGIYRDIAQAYTNQDIMAMLKPTGLAPARLVKPKFAMTRERAMKHAYNYANILLTKSGYTPSWLSEFQVQGTNSATTGTKGQ